MKLLVATNNSGKLQEIKELLADLGAEIVSPLNIPQLRKLKVKETGSTFRENALLKAQAYADLSGLTTISDDSGLEVEALDGKPGVKSARFSPGSDHDRNLKLLSLMKGIKNRKARFVAVVCYFDSQKKSTHYFQGKIEGKISLAEKGSGGFGYDSIFIPQGYNKTFAELGSEVKNKLSHRAGALKKLKKFLLKS